MGQSISLTLALILLVGSMHPATAQQAPRSFSLGEAISFGLDHSTVMKENRRVIAEAEQRKREVISRGLPQVNASLSYTNYVSLPVSLIPAEFVGGDPGDDFAGELDGGGDLAGAEDPRSASCRRGFSDGPVSQREKAFFTDFGCMSIWPRKVAPLSIVTRGDTALPWTDPACLMTISSTPYRFPVTSPSTTTRLP